MNAKLLFSAAVIALAAALPAAAQEAGTWSLSLGIATVDPKTDNGNLAGANATIDSSTRPTITGEYFVYKNVGIELLAAVPFEHNVSLNGVEAASTKVLPPTLSLQYHFANSSAWTPFVGLGVNYTLFYDSDSPLGDISIENSWGLAGHVGVDYAFNDNWAVRLDARWIGIESDVTLNGADIGKVEVDPLVYGLSVVYNF